MPAASAPITLSPLLSTLPGLRHGFTNLQLPAPQREEVENATATAHQVHKANLLWLTAFEKRARQADALATFQPGLAIGVFSADCAPVLVAAQEESTKNIYAVLTVHAGWRGTALGIAGNSLRAFAGECLLRHPQSRFVAAIGPCISRDSFEVGQEVVEAFPNAEAVGLASFHRVEGERRKYLFDLPGANLRQLQSTAQEDDLRLEVDVLGHCTVKATELYPSYRRLGEKAGRILSFLQFVG